MTVDNINVEAAVKRVNDLIVTEKDLSPALRASLEVLLLLVTILANRLGLTSKNSSKPPSTDPNRLKVRREPSDRKPGGQFGHRGATLKPVADPDEVRIITVDQDTLPQGAYREVGYESRQVIDLDISTVVTEWRAQILEDQNGKRYVAPFPKDVTRPVQYGIGVKVNSVYMSQYQLIPYHRIEDHFWDQLGLPLSAGSIHNFNQDTYERLESFDSWVREQLRVSPLIHVDETGINIGGNRRWLHTVSNDRLTCLYPHAKRGCEAMDEMGILPEYKGIMCHDHWKPYFKYGGAHALCNAHHLRELELAVEQDKQKWAEQMIVLLKQINKATHEAGGRLEVTESEHYRKRYRDLLHAAETECPPPDQTGRRKKAKRHDQKHETFWNA